MYRSQFEERPILVFAFNGELVGIARDNGETRWSCQLPGAGGAVDFVIDRERVFAATYPGRLYCVDYLSGMVVWAVDISDNLDLEEAKEELRPALLLDGRYLFVSNWQGELSCFSTEGVKLWSRPAQQEGLVSAPALGVPGNVRSADTIGKS
jgi:outer membrane protein assembly factor BamB